MDNSFVKTPEEVCSFFNVDKNHGLKAKQVEELRSKYGKNGKRHTHKKKGHIRDPYLFL